MNRAIKDKAKYVVLTKAGTDRSENYPAVIAWFLRLIFEIKANYWLWRVNRMSEGEIMKRYYELTKREENDDYFIRRAAAGSDERATE